MDNTWVAALWGLGGASPYALTKLVTAFWAASDVTPEARKLAVGNCFIALSAGPIFAGAMAPWLVFHAKGANLGTVAVVIGLMCNVIWPMLTERKNLAPIVSGLLNRLGGWLSGMGTALNGDRDVP